MNRSLLAAAVALAALSSSRPALADDPCDPAGSLVTTGIGTWSEELTRLSDLAPGLLARQSGILRRGGLTTRTICQDAPALLWGARYVAPAEPSGVVVVPPTLKLAYQSLAPGGGNDGMLWQGRGFSTLLSGGFHGRWGPLSAQLAPEVTWSQNQRFRMVDNGETGDLRFRNAFYGDALDVPQRFGDRGYARAGLGQSFLALEGYGTRLAVSTENLWWGPGIRNAILLTNNAQGFPHLSVGTARPVDVWVGKLEAELLWGIIEKSPYVSSRPRRWLNGLALTFSPRWIPGLYLGGGRIIIEDLETLQNQYLLSVFQALSKEQVGGDNPVDNQMLSAWFRWVMPEIELYGEYAMDDFLSDSAVAKYGDRAAAWTLGFQKRWVQGPRWWRVMGELAKTRSNLPPGYATSIYVHGRGSDWTNQGQLLGASIGPGADAQYLAVDAFVASGRIGGYFERIRRNEEVFWGRVESPLGAAQHDVELVLGLRQVILTRHAEIGWDVAAGHRWNRDFVKHYSPTFRAMVTVSVPLDPQPLLGGTAAPVPAATTGTAEQGRRE